jgi:hypothetical protein
VETSSNAIARLNSLRVRVVPARSADLHQVRIPGAAGLEHRVDARAEGKLVDPWCRAVAGDAEQLRAPGIAGALGAKPGAAAVGDQRRLEERLHVVDHRRPAQVTALDGKRRADTRNAALAFQGFDQRRLLAAYIGTGAEMDADVEVKAGLAEYAAAQQSCLAALGQHALEVRQQEAIFAAQVDESLAGADHRRAHGHPLDHRVGLCSEEHTILERAGFTLVGVADHRARPRAGTAQGPLASGGKARAATTPQARVAKPGQVGVGADCQRCREGLAASQFRVEDDVPAADIVLDTKPALGPGGHGHRPVDVLSHALDARPVHRRQGATVDEQARALVTQTRAGGEVDAGQVIAAADGTPDKLTELRRARPGTLHTIDNVVAEQDVVGAAWLAVQEGVEIDQAENFRARDAQRHGQLIHGGGGM